MIFIFWPSTHADNALFTDFLVTTDNKEKPFHKPVVLYRPSSLHKTSCGILNVNFFKKK